MLVSKKSSIPGHRVHPCALNMGLLTKVAKQMQFGGKKKSVDSWLFMQTRTILGRHPEIKLDLSDDWMDGVDTHGYNQISRMRGSLIGSNTEKPKNPFREPTCREPTSIREILPQDIAERLYNLPRDIAEPAPLGQNLAERTQSRMFDRISKNSK